MPFKTNSDPVNILKCHLNQNNDLRVINTSLISNTDILLEVYRCEEEIVVYYFYFLKFYCAHVCLFVLFLIYVQVA